MLLTLWVIQLIALTLANPFHKYPYVFLLDIGNEELEKVNTEQFRVSKQGGSLALRYPAIGNGEDIAHVRVSGIDFGTDLKATVVDGGPGYKYVVLVLMGNPGVSFEAVITIQTVPSDTDETSLQNIDNSSSSVDAPPSEENYPNNSAEDLSDSAESEEASQVNIKENAEFTQESSNVYSYAVNEGLNGYGNKVHSNGNDEDIENDENSENEEENNSEQQDINLPEQENSNQAEDSNVEYEDYTNEDDSPSLIENESDESSSNDDTSHVIDDQYTDDDEDETQDQEKTNVYEEYEGFRRNKYEKGEVYSQNPQLFIPGDSGTIYIEESGENESPLDLEEIFGDDYDDANDRQNSDTNNNYYIDRNEVSAIAY